MIIHNTDTATDESITYAPTGCDCMQDISAEDTLISFNEESEQYEADTDTINWWKDYVEQAEKSDAYTAAAKEELDAATVETTIEKAACCDMGDQPGAIICALESLANDKGFEFREYSDGTIGIVNLSGFDFKNVDSNTEMQNDEFYDFCVIGLDPKRKFWTDSLDVAKKAAEWVGESIIWDTNENEEVK